MTIGFLHVDTPTATADGYDCARAMIVSAKRVMPRVPIVQFTDERTKAVKGVDAVRRKPSEPMGLLRMRHCAGVQGRWLFVDTDVIFQQCVRHVFKTKKFDIAITTRNWSHVRAANGFSQRMPYNTGIVFSRCPHFWAEVYTRLRDLEPDQQHFMGEQQVICDVAQEDRYRVARLRGSVYNFPPEVPSEKPTSKELEAAACILHFKGQDRKALMLKRYRKAALRCA